MLTSYTVSVTVQVSASSSLAARLLQQRPKLHPAQAERHVPWHALHVVLRQELFNNRRLLTVRQLVIDQLLMQCALPELHGVNEAELALAPLLARAVA